LVRAVVVVVVTRPVTVVVREVTVPAVGAGVAVAAAVKDVVVEAAGWSGAAMFCTCVAANAVMLARDVSVAAVAMARRITPERMSGGRWGMRHRTSRQLSGYMRLA
jgi:hypothetical protein